MSALDAIEKALNALITRIHDRRLRKEANDVHDEVVRLNTEEKKKKEEETKKKKETLPTQAITDIPAYKVEKTFNLERLKGNDNFWVLQPNERKAIPDHLRQILADYALAVGDSEQNEALIRTRLDAIFLTTLAAKKRLEFSQSSHRSSSLSQGSYKSVHIQFEKHLKFEWIYNKVKCLLQGRTDYSFWHKDANMAETNTIIVEAKAVGKLDWHQALAYMGIIHQARRRAKRPDVSVYGIATDSYYWFFIKIDQKSRVSKLALDWADGQEMEIYSFLHKLIDSAAVLSPMSTVDDPMTGVFWISFIRNSLGSWSSISHLQEPLYLFEVWTHGHAYQAPSLVKVPSKKTPTLYEDLPKAYAYVIMQLHTHRIGLAYFLLRNKARESDG
ncbi:hypothetical protein AnigIFM56816_001963 [Aspergillus niger]|nr:hypothetical protein AnigIFM56816_001963 [Aspergillus niger]